MTRLPQPFVRRIRDLLGEREAGEFLQAYDRPRAYGLRLNPGKLNPDDIRFAGIRDRFGLRRVPWCDTGYYYDENARPGKHPYHAAGLFYIQEPSAMIAAELLDPQPGEIVLDLAAAPGGKTTQIAARMKGRGLLVANEIHPSRAKILAENVERMGIANAVVVNSAPGPLAERWPEAFDRIMLDAPCSGEGMFRKDPDAAAEWSEEAVAGCAARQRDILRDAAAMLRPGGRLVYSTCTFNREENERTVRWLLGEFPEFALLKEERLWPHRVEGEGHYAAVLEKRSPDRAPPENKGSKSRARSADRKAAKTDKAAATALQLFHAFAEAALPGFRLPADGVPLLFGDSLYWLPQPDGSPLSAASLDGLRTPRPGLHLGDAVKGRFEPSHALAMALDASAAACAADYPADSPEVAAYLRGESLAAGSEVKGWGLLTADGWPLGWFKASDRQLKNRLPKGLRML
ncbi:RsmB/NOP family class I SAM-dependent RNA methyltransferase [Cohnella algarum]|uniref:RsmB/NOP family class I SAM-dependent RNA methyltransferase n=1 Tax=Cohnella algarum TaxID=2044859 RepID=UPI0019674D67|nr:RsmB/NOP family class I SAM-dependent RNA methyltransferase [Cohnella algarum]MBN2984763.1 RsmB/NOP family class I SAM-dependent RNA methyltransferase [Cohnella algarum]